MTQQGGHGWEIDRFDQTSRCVVAEPVGVDVGHIRTPAKDDHPGGRTEPFPL